MQQFKLFTASTKAELYALINGFLSVHADDIEPIEQDNLRVDWDYIPAEAPATESTRVWNATLFFTTTTGGAAVSFD